MNNVISIKPLTRVEGHGAVNIFMDGCQAQKVELRLFESPRLFEALLLGKKYDEIPEIICRICSLCSTVHRITSVLAIEDAFGVSVPEVVSLHRELILYGGHIQSHALHLFFLALPDYLGVPSLVDLAKNDPEQLQRALRIKKVGNQLQEFVGGRLIHPVTIIAGGMGKPLGRDGLLILRDSLLSIMEDVRQTCALFASFPALKQRSLPIFMSLDCLEKPLFGDTLCLSDGNRLPTHNYSAFLREETPATTNSKWSTVAGQTVTAGAIARLALEMPLQPEATAFKKSAGQFRSPSIAANNLAQAVELLHAVERSLLIIDMLLDRRGEKSAPPSFAPRVSRGTAAMEAPRGTLIHSYSFDGGGRCTGADIITPTAINQRAMEQELFDLARSLQGAAENELCFALERRVRDYDPCISCAVHVIRLK